MKKIMFNDKFGLTQAVLDGRKTQTRRLASPFLPDAVCIGYARFEIVAGRELRCWKKGTSFIKYNLPYKVGEMVAVAQSYKEAGIDFIECDVRNGHNHFWGNARGMKGWNNKMFVLPELMPNRIRMTNVRIQKLQDISDEDCLKEGIRKVVNENSTDVQYYVGNAACFETPREAFAYLVNKVSGKGTWDSNPWVWVYDFELLNEKTMNKNNQEKCCGSCRWYCNEDIYGLGWCAIERGDRTCGEICERWKDIP